MRQRVSVKVCKCILKLWFFFHGGSITSGVHYVVLWRTMMRRTLYLYLGCTDEPNNIV